VKESKIGDESQTKCSERHDRRYERERESERESEILVGCENVCVERDIKDIREGGRKRERERESRTMKTKESSAVYHSVWDDRCRA